MNKKYAIFDMDGTLVDSMSFWRSLGYEYLKSEGIECDLDEIIEKIKPMTMTQSSEYFRSEFGLPYTAEEIAAEMNSKMDMHYKTDVPLKAGVAEYLKVLKDRGVKMCVASATAGPLMEACLSRLGVLDDFDFILSCEEVGKGKHDPDVYFAAAEKLGSEPGETAVYEDALYAAETAVQAGFYVIGVYDDSALRHWEKLCDISDETIENWNDAI